jgi:hypothetical protein
MHQETTVRFSRLEGVLVRDFGSFLVSDALSCSRSSIAQSCRRCTNAKNSADVRHLKARRNSNRHDFFFLIPIAALHERKLLHQNAWYTNGAIGSHTRYM